MSLEKMPKWGEEPEGWLDLCDNTAVRNRFHEIRHLVSDIVGEIRLSILVALRLAGPKADERGRRMVRVEEFDEFIIGADARRCREDGTTYASSEQECVDAGIPLLDLDEFSREEREACAQILSWYAMEIQLDHGRLNDDRRDERNVSLAHVVVALNRLAEIVVTPID